MYKNLSYLFFGRQKHPQPKTLYKADIQVLSYIGENPRSRSSVLSRHLPPQALRGERRSSLARRVTSPVPDLACDKMDYGLWMDISVCNLYLLIQ